MSSRASIPQGNCDFLISRQHWQMGHGGKGRGGDWASTTPVAMWVEPLQVRAWEDGTRVEDNNHSFNTDNIDVGILSVLFWNYMMMLNLLAKTLNRLLVFAECCPCHFASYLLRGVELGSANITKLRSVWAQCPLRGQLINVGAIANTSYDASPIRLLQ